jgi:hypothetical protein
VRQLHLSTIISNYHMVLMCELALVSPTLSRVHRIPDPGKKLSANCYIFLSRHFFKLPRGSDLRVATCFWLLLIPYNWVTISVKNFLAISCSLSYHFISRNYFSNYHVVLICALPHVSSYVLSLFIGFLIMDKIVGKLLHFTFPPFFQITTWF